MTTRPTPRLRIGLVNWFLDDNEPLAGDLVEECPHRSRTWFWRQLMFAVLTRTATGAAASLRDPAKLVGRLASFAMFMVLCFQVVVTGSLLATVLPRIRVAGHEWLTLVVLLSLPVGWGTGNVSKRLHSRSRVAMVVLCGASAAVIGLVTNSALTSTEAVFFPALGVQGMVAMVFVGGLVGGTSSRWFKRDRASTRTEREPQRSYRT
jgi:hypothetical protein